MNAKFRWVTVSMREYFISLKTSAHKILINYNWKNNFTKEK